MSREISYEDAVKIVNATALFMPIVEPAVGQGPAHAGEGIVEPDGDIYIDGASAHYGRGDFYAITDEGHLRMFGLDQDNAAVEDTFACYGRWVLE